MVINSNNDKEVELITIITVEPKYQELIVDNVQEILRKFARAQSGFITSKIYKSIDGTRIAYYIRWKNQSDGLAWFENIASALEVMKDRVKNADYHLYELVETPTP